MALERRLWLIRHAKSSWADPGQRDIDRELNPRGRRDGPRMSRWLAEQTHHASWIWTSDAARARATAQFVQSAFGTPHRAVVTEHRLFHADPNTLLDVIRTTPPQIASVALVAHNPGLTNLTNLLANLPQNRTATDNLPTFGVALFAVSEPWCDCSSRATALLKLVAPKTLPLQR